MSELHALMVEYRSAYRILIGKPEINHDVEEPGCGWEDNIKSGHKEV